MELYSKETYLESEAFPFAVLFYETLPSRVMRPHYHDFFEMVYVANGQGEHIYKGRSYPILKGDFFVINPGVVHDYIVTGAEPLEVYNVMFIPSLLHAELATLAEEAPFVNLFYVEPFLRETSSFEYHLKLSLYEAQEVKQRIHQLEQEFKRKQLGYQLVIKALLVELLVYLSRCYKGENIQRIFHSDEKKAIMQLCDFIEEHYAHPIQLEQVCRMCGMSQTVFTKKFKQIVGKTFVEYRNEVRIKAALQGLRETDDKIIHIAQQVGIHDLSHFNHLFKQHMQLTPRQYRNMHRGI